MPHEMKLPSLGEDAGDEAEVSFWYVEEGESVAEGDDMVEMVTDKAAFTVPAPVAGSVVKLLVAEGDKVKVGQTMALMEE